MNKKLVKQLLYDEFCAIVGIKKFIWVAVDRNVYGRNWVCMQPDAAMSFARHRDDEDYIITVEDYNADHLYILSILPKEG